MKILKGRDAADYIKERHARQVRGLKAAPRLAIIRQGASAATDVFLGLKSRYGADIGAGVDIYDEAPEHIVERIRSLNADPGTTGIMMQLPLAAGAELAAQAIAAIDPAKDVDGMGDGSPFEAATPKAMMWLLAAHNIDIKGRLAVVGQGRLVGKPLADRLEASGLEVLRLDDQTKDLAAELREADIIFTATGQAGLITSDMVKTGAVVVDAGAPASDLAADVLARHDLKITPNPGGVGPMTVAALFDNLLIAAQS